MEINSAQEQNAARCGCDCLVPECLPPVSLCQSVSGSVGSVGYTKPLPPPALDADGNPIPVAPPAWSIWRQLGWRRSHVWSGSTTSDSNPPSFTNSEGSGTAERFFGYTYDINYDGGVIAGGDCISYVPVIASVCTYTGNATYSVYNRFNWGSFPDYSSEVKQINLTVGEILDLSGEPDPAHAAWQDEADLWDLDHPDYAQEVADYEVAYQAWLDNDQAGDEPVLAPPRPEEPAEFYPPCSFFTRQTSTDWTWSCDEPDGCTLPSEGEGDPNPVVTVAIQIASNTGLDLNSPGVDGYTQTNTDDPEEYSLESNLATWRSAAQAVLFGDLQFPATVDPDAECPLGDACDSAYAANNPAYGDPATVSATKSRYRYGIPADWRTWQARKDAFDAWVAAGSDPAAPVEDPGPRRTCYHLQWDEKFTSHAWRDWEIRKNAHDAWLALAGDPDRGPEPEAPGVEPTRPNKVISREWIWDGTDENMDSPWYDIAIPSTLNGDNDRVNLGVKCYQSARFGVKPTYHGEIYAFDE